MHNGPRLTDTVSPARPLVAYYHYDAVSETWTWSDEMYLIHGYEPGDVALTTDLLLALRHPDDRTRVVTEIKAALATAEPFSCYHRSLDKDSRTHRVVAVGGGAMSPDGALVAMEGYLIDLTPDVRRETHTAADIAVAAATEHRSAIEQAKGVLMGVFAIDEDSAFSMLRWFSQQHNVKVSLLATRLVSEVTTGEAADAETRSRVDRLLHDLSTQPDASVI
jgi:hypothetical protein